MRRVITIAMVLVTCLWVSSVARMEVASPSPPPLAPEEAAGPDDVSAICVFAFEMAAREEDPDLSAAVRACVTVDEWLSGAMAYPDALAGVEPLRLLLDLCSGEPLGMYPLCEDLQGFLPTPDAQLGSDARAYLEVREAHDAGSGAIAALWEAAGDDTVKLGEAWAARAAHSEAFMTALAGLQVAPEFQREVGQLADRTRVLMNLERLLAGDPWDSDRYARWQAAVDAQAEAALEVERALGLASPVVDAGTARESTLPGIPRLGIGDRAAIREDGAPVMRVKAVAVRQNDAFRTGRVRERPERGHVYLSVFVRYQSRARLADYDAYDWQVRVGGEPYGRRTLVAGGPKPSLASGTLRNGQKIGGWVTFEVPRRGEVSLAYQSDFASSDEDPPFEIVVRKR